MGTIKSVLLFTSSHRWKPNELKYHRTAWIHRAQRRTPVFPVTQIRSAGQERAEEASLRGRRCSGPAEVPLSQLRWMAVVRVHKSKSRLYIWIHCFQYLSSGLLINLWISTLTKTLVLWSGKKKNEQENHNIVFGLNGSVKKSYKKLCLCKCVLMIIKDC